MCRFIAYMGNPILLDDVLYKPKNSLIEQSIRARETDEPLNGDGFGIGWYSHEIEPTPGVFKSLRPAWNDHNLKHIAPKIRSGCFFAHVRAASAGGVSYANTHPFYFKRLLFMHNGDIGDFTRVKRYLRRSLSDEVYDWIQGQTDSEHLFALFIDIFHKRKAHFTAEDFAKVLREAIAEVEDIRAKHNLTSPSFINATLTDGRSMIAIRYVSDTKEPAPSLHYSEAAYYEYREGACHMVKSNGEIGAVLVVSEKLNSYKAEWKDIPVNHLLLVSDDLTTSLQPL